MQEQKINVDFSEALLALKSGNKITRTGWNGKGMYLGLQLPDENSANTLPYIYIVTAEGSRVPWVASHTDLFSQDWDILV